MTIATNMAGRGTDIILGGNTDYMARLKVREALLPRLVRPEEGHRPPAPLQREASSGFAAAAAAPAKPPSEARALGRLYPCELSPDTNAALAEVARELPIDAERIDKLPQRCPPRVLAVACDEPHSPVRSDETEAHDRTSFTDPFVGNPSKDGLAGQDDK